MGSVTDASTEVDPTPLAVSGRYFQKARVKSKTPISARTMTFLRDGARAANGARKNAMVDNTAQAEGDRTQPFIPPTSFDGFSVERPLGRGGMGHVYLGHDLELDRPVALKFIAHAQASGTALERFRREARAIADLWEAPPASIAECSARVRRASNVGSWYCFYRLSFEHRDLIPAVVAHLERIRAREPRNTLATFAEALAEDLRGGDDTLALYEQAQAEFRSRGDLEGELHVAAAVVGHASWFGEAELGAAKLARGLVLAQQLGDPDALAYMYVHATELALRTGDYGRAEVRVRQSEEQLTPAAPPWLSYRVPPDWGRVYSATRRPWRAMQAYQRAAAATE